MAVPPLEPAQPSQPERLLIFVVEDDADIARLICFHLGAAGYATRWFPSSWNVVEFALKEHPALFLLDIMIPGSDGLELCRHIRRESALLTSHIIFLTAKAGEVDRIRGLDIGGDDYIVKPFSPRELIARVRAVLRSLVPPSEPETLRIGTIEIDGAAMIVRANGKVVTTTTREFRLLQYLARHSSRVFSRDQLLDAVWTEGSFVTPRSVDVYVRRLREKIEPDPDNPVYLKTIRGIGYRFDEPK
ncbi:MAG: response regulator transcription factor [Acidobacteria bacterium]|nr:response regulator transcription factor [Acidobacteriota bacterium]